MEYFLIFLVVFVIIGTIAQYIMRGAENFVSAANYRALNGDPKGAIKYYDRAIKKEPKSKWAAIAFCERGELLRDIQKDEKKAIEGYKNAIKINPNLAYVYVKYGEIKMEEKKYSDAQDYFTKAIDLGLKNPFCEILNETFDFWGGRCYYKRANARELLKNIDGAIEDLETAIVLNPLFTYAKKKLNKLKKLKS